MRVLAAAALYLCLFASTAFADGPVNVAASVDRRGITIGDPIALALVVETDAGYRITDSGVGRIMDEFEVQCGPQRGTKVTMTKWRMRDQLELLREKRR